VPSPVVTADWDRSSKREAVAVIWLNVRAAGWRVTPLNATTGVPTLRFAPVIGNDRVPAGRSPAEKR